MLKPAVMRTMHTASRKHAQADRERVSWSVRREALVRVIVSHDVQKSLCMHILPCTAVMLACRQCGEQY